MHKLLLGAVALTMAACGGDGPASTDAGPVADGGAQAPDGGAQAPDGGAADMDAGVEIDAGPTAPTWTAVQALFQAKCSPCHDPGNVSRRTVVSQYAAIVGRERGGLTYVAPGDASASFVYRKVEGTQGAFCAENSLPTRNCGGIMPTRPRASLTESELALVRGWIDDGALEN